MLHLTAWNMTWYESNAVNLQLTQLLISLTNSVYNLFTTFLQILDELLLESETSINVYGRVIIQSDRVNSRLDMLQCGYLPALIDKCGQLDIVRIIENWTLNIQFVLANTNDHDKLPLERLYRTVADRGGGGGDKSAVTPLFSIFPFSFRHRGLSGRQTVPLPHNVNVPKQFLKKEKCWSPPPPTPHPCSANFLRAGAHLHPRPFLFTKPESAAAGDF